MERKPWIAWLLWLLSGFGLLGMNLVYLRAYRWAVAVQVTLWAWAFGLPWAMEQGEAWVVVWAVACVAVWIASSLVGLEMLLLPARRQALNERHKAGEMERRDVLWAFVLWVLSGCGFLGGHRIYLGCPLCGAATLALVWALILLGGPDGDGLMISGEVTMVTFLGLIVFGAGEVATLGCVHSNRI